MLRWRPASTSGPLLQYNPRYDFLVRAAVQPLDERKGSIAKARRGEGGVQEICLAVLVFSGLMAELR